MAFCQKCGAEMEDNCTVCPNCQAEVETTEAASIPESIVLEKPKKSIFKKWWFWLISVVVIVAVLFTIGFVSLLKNQERFKDYYNVDMKEYRSSLIKVDEHIQTTIELLEESYNKAEKYWKENDVEKLSKDMLDGVNAYKAEGDDIKEMHSEFIECTKSLNDAVSYIGEELEKRGPFDRLEELYNKYSDATDKYVKVRDKYVEEYGLEVIEEK